MSSVNEKIRELMPALLIRMWRGRPLSWYFLAKARQEANDAKFNSWASRMTPSELIEVVALILRMASSALVVFLQARMMRAGCIPTRWQTVP